ncbi:hypothetical protein MMC18_003945 [Xylographa bjoerkii]|nr:hypothetical protein [Xylographa bjoerkii]
MDSLYEQLPDAESELREVVPKQDIVPLIQLSVESIGEHDNPPVEQCHHVTWSTSRFQGLGIVDEEIILDKDYSSNKASHDVRTSPYDPEETSPTPHGSPAESPLKLPPLGPTSLWRRCLDFRSDTWLPEVLAMLLSFLALVAMVVVLYLNNHTPSSNLFWRLHVNSWVSGFNTVSKTAITFVTASAISQSKWVWFRRRKAMAAMSLSVASLGALITLLALGMDFFVQTTISSQLVSKSVGSATTTRIQNITTQTFGMSREGFENDPMTSALDEGISGIPVPFSVDCSTGNCTWDHLITSLALCNMCQDISREISNTTDPSVNRPFGELPNGVSLKPLDDWPIPNDFVANTVALLDPNFGPPNSMVNLTALSIDQAFQCSFYLCVNEYDLSVSNGILSQNAVKSWPWNSTNNRFPVGTINITLPTDSYDAAGTPNQIFTVEGVLYQSLQSLLTKNLAATINFVAETNTSGIDSNPTIIHILAGVNDSGTPSVNLSNIPAIIANLTESLNARMRQPPNPASVEVVLGNAMRMGTYVEVGWYWLIYPLCLFLMCAAFLAATMWTSRREKVMVWKDSPMPLLFHGLAGKHRHEVRTVQKVSQMDRLADDMEVKLVKVDSCWRFE